LLRPIAILALLVLVVSGLALRPHLEEWLVRGAVRALERDHGLRLRVRTAELHLLRLRLEVTDLALERSPDSAGRLSIAVPYARVDLAWSSLFGLRRGRVRITQLLLDHPRVVTDGELLRARRPPGERREPLALDLIAQRLRVTGGVWIHEDQATSLDLELSGAELRASVAGDGRTMTGQLRFEARMAHEQLAAPLEASLATQFRLRGERVELFDLRLRSAPAEIEGSGAFDLRSGSRLDASLRLRADLASLIRLLPGPQPVVAGRLTGTLSVARDGGAWHVGGPVEVTQLRAGRFDVPSVRGELMLDDVALRLHDVSGTLLGGQARGKIDVVLTAPPRASIDLEAEALDAGRLLEWLGVPVPLRGQASGTLHLAGAPARRRTWSGAGTFALVAGPQDARGVPAAGAGELTVEEGHLVLTAGDVRTPDTRFALEVHADLAERRVPGQIVLRGATDDAAITQRDVLRILDWAGLRAPDVVLRPLAGSGAVSARFAIGGAQELDLDLDLAAGAWGSQRFERARLRLESRAGRIDIRELDLLLGAARLHGGLGFTADPFQLHAIDLEAQDVEVTEIAALFDVATDLRGRASGRLRATRESGALEGSGALRLRDGRWLGEPFDEATAELVVAAERLDFREVQVRGPAVDLAGAAALDLASGRVAAQVDDGRVRVERLAALTAAATPVGAELSVSGPLQVDEEGAHGLFELMGPELRVGPRSLGSIAGQLELRPGEVELRLRGVDPGGFRATAVVGLGAPLPLRAEIALEGWSIDGSHDLGLPARLVADGRFTITGPLADPARWDVHGTIADAVIHIGARTLQSTAGIPLQIRDGTLDLGPGEVRGASADLHGRLRYAIASGEMDASLDGTADLASIALAVPELRGEGDVAVAIEAHGTLAALRLSGALRLTRGRLRHLGLPYVLQAATAEVALRGATAEIVALHGVFGGGEIDGTGRVELGAAGVESFALTLAGSGVRLELPEGFDGIYDARLEVDGTPERITVTGRADLLRGLWSSELERPQLFGAPMREFAPGETSYLAPRTFLDIDVRAPNRVWIRNSLAEIEAAVDLRVGGTLERPQVTGRVFALEGGRLEYRGLRYQVRSGTLEFTNPDRIEPFVTVEADTSVSGYDIQLRASGTPDRLTYELTSSPALSTQDIIALLATGRTMGDLGTGSTGGGEFTGDVAANYFAGVLTDPFEDQLASLVGLDTLRVDPLLIDRQDPTTRVTLGKEIRNDVTVLYSHRADQAEEDLYQVEWRANRRATVTTERATNGGVAANLYYTHRYWWRRPVLGPAGEAAGKPAPSPTDGPRVGSLRVEVEPEAGLDAEELRARVPLHAGDPYRRSDLYAGVEALRSVLVRHGHLEAEVSGEPVETTPGTVDVVYRVRAGPRYVVEFAGVRPKEERKLRQTLESLWVDSLFVGDLYEDSVEAIRLFFQSRGFFAVDVEHEVQSGPEPVLRFRVDRGAEVQVARVVIEGATAVGEERVRRQMLTRPPGILGRRSFDPAVLEADLAAIRNLYRTSGYLRVRVEAAEVRLSVRGDTVEITLRIDEGPLFTVRSLTFGDVPGVARETLESWSGLAVGQPVSLGLVADAEAALRRALDREGRAAATVHVSPTFAADGGTDLRFDVVAGSTMRVAAVSIEGNFLTKDETILDALDLRVGDPLTHERLISGQRALYRLGTLQSVRVDHEPFRAGDEVERLVHVRVSETRPLRLAVGAGYNTESALNFSLGTSFDNVGGRGRSIGTRVILNNELRNFQVFGRSPKLFGAATPGLASLVWETDRQTPGFAVERWSTALRAERRFNVRWQGFVRYAYQLIDVFDIVDPVAVQQEQLQDARLGSAEVSMSYDTRDDPVAPTRGLRGAFNVAVFAEPLLSDFSFLRGTAELSRTWTLRPRLSFVSVLRAGIEDRFAGTVDVPISERFFAGGSSTVRGFETDLLGPLSDDLPTGGEGMFVLNEELRFPMFGALRGVAFYDAGNVYRYLTDFDPTDLRHVLGLGIRFETPIGPLRAEYGWKLDRETGEEPGQFFFSIGNAF